MSQKDSFFSVQDGKPIDPLKFGYADIFNRSRRDPEQPLKKISEQKVSADQSLGFHEDKILRSILARVERIRERRNNSPVTMEGEPLMEEHGDRRHFFRILKAEDSRPKQPVGWQDRSGKLCTIEFNQNTTEPLRSTTQKCLSNLLSQIKFPEPVKRMRRITIRQATTTQDVSQEPQRVSTQTKLRSTINYFRQSAERPTDTSGESRKVLIRKRHSRQNSFGLEQNQLLRQSEPYVDWLTILNWTNAMHQTIEPTSSYRALLEKGNNHRLVKAALKLRPWWIVIECCNLDEVHNFGEYNLVWCQNKYQKVVGLLPEHTPRVYGENFRTRSIQVRLDCSTKNAPTDQEQGLSRIVQNCKNDCLTITPSAHYQQFSYSPNILKAHNHLQYHREISNKKNLFRNLRTYYLKNGLDPFERIPLTFHVTGTNDPEFQAFVDSCVSGSVWLVKPGENTNRGTGIDVVSSVEEVQESIRRHASKHRTFILQRYIMPFLYKQRKFDIRCYMLITSLNHTIKGYWYEDGYIRTSSKLFTLDSLSNRLVHLTNDAVQKRSNDYGKYQPANKLSFQEFERYLSESHPTRSFFRDVYPQLIAFAADSLEACWTLLDRKHRQHTFELFGLDFLIDEQFKPWLIEVNTNPCLEESSSLLGRIIPAMLDNALRIALDPIYPPPKRKDGRVFKLPNPFATNKFTLIFDHRIAPKIQPHIPETPTLFTEDDPQ